MEHPITPPPELVRQWDSEAVDAEMPEQLYIATQAARWGDDQRLEACEKWMHVQHLPGFACQLHAAMRPKPPSLKEQAISDRCEQLGNWEETCLTAALRARADHIRADILAIAIATDMEHANEH